MRLAYKDYFFSYQTHWDASPVLQDGGECQVDCHGFALLWHSEREDIILGVEVRRESTLCKPCLIQFKLPPRP